MHVRVSPGRPPARWQVRVPGSKSLTNRALLLAGVAGRPLAPAPPAARRRHEVMADALRALGAGVGSRTAATGWSRARRGAAAGAGGPTCGAGWRAPSAASCCRCWRPGAGRFAVDAHDAAASPAARTGARRRCGPGGRDRRRGVPADARGGGLRGGISRSTRRSRSQFLSRAADGGAARARADARCGSDALVSRPYLQLTLDAMRAFGVDRRVGRRRAAGRAAGATGPPTTRSSPTPRRRRTSSPARP